MDNLIYLDNNATTRPDPEVVAAMQPYFDELYFNPSGGYGPADQMMADLAGARERVAALIGARSDEIASPAARPRATTPPSTRRCRAGRSGGTW